VPWEENYIAFAAFRRDALAAHNGSRKSHCNAYHITFIILLFTFTIACGPSSHLTKAHPNIPTLLPTSRRGGLTRIVPNLAWSGDRQSAPLVIQFHPSLFPAKTGTKEHQLKIQTINNTTPTLTRFALPSLSTQTGLGMTLGEKHI
jgi:hypothetical protein